MPVDANTCTACGIPFTLEGTQLVSQGTSEPNALASWALTLGVLSIPTFCFPPIGVVAVVLGILAIRRAGQLGESSPGKRMAIIGLLLGLLSLSLFAMNLIFL